ncbi:MAG: response regulator [Elusimicrobia bacterium]|nr:response regulator [Elusimicrobiota bacterium]
MPGEGLEIERGPRIGVAGGAKAVRPTVRIEDPLTPEEKAKYEGLLGPAQPPQPPAAVPQAIVVEDDPPHRARMIEVLKQWEMDVEGFADGTSALKALAAKRVDLLIVDLTIPGHDGFEVIRGARSYLKLRDTVIIAVATTVDPKDETVSLNVGADMFYGKPMAASLFEARLKPFVRRLYDKLGR